MARRTRIVMRSLRSIAPLHHGDEPAERRRPVIG